LFWIDDFSGRYEGKLRYQYRDEFGKLQDGELEHVKLVNQTGNRIVVSSFTKKVDGNEQSNAQNINYFLNLL